MLWRRRSSPSVSGECWPFVRQRCVAFHVPMSYSCYCRKLNSSDKLVLVNKLGAKSVHGDDAISFTKTVDDSNMYYVISMCKQKEQAPYSFVLYKDGQPHTLTTREACTSNGIETISLPAKNFPDATSLSIINIGNTDLVVSVYEVKEPHHE